MRGWFIGTIQFRQCSASERLGQGAGVSNHSDRKRLRAVQEALAEPRPHHLQRLRMPGRKSISGWLEILWFQTVRSTDINGSFLPNPEPSFMNRAESLPQCDTSPERHRTKRICAASAGGVGESDWKGGVSG